MKPKPLRWIVPNMIFNMFKCANTTNAFIHEMVEGVLKLQQSERGSPGAPEMSFLYELGINSLSRILPIC